MLHLALKNLKGRKAYSAIIITAVAVAVVMTLFTTFMTSGVRQELESNRQMIGPDLAIVPPGNKEIGHIYLSKGPPAQGMVPVEVLGQLGAFPELEALTPQKRLGLAAVGTLQARLIGFDPLTDFVVHPWLDKRNTERFPGRDTGVALGAKVNAGELPPDLPAAKGNSAAMGGRLLATGTYMDTSIFIPRPTAEITAEPAWILLKIRQDVSLDIAANRLEVNIAGVEILRRPELFKAIHDQLYRLLEGGGFRAAMLLTIVGALLLTGGIFTLMAHERRREFGLLKALGARNTFIFRLIMSEAAVLGSAGATLGLGMAAICLLCAHTGIIPHGIPLALSSSAEVLRNMFATMALTVVIAVLTALYPALAASRLEPYAAIRSGE